MLSPSARTLLLGVATLAACGGSASDIEELKKGQKDILAKLDGLDKTVQQIKAQPAAAQRPQFDFDKATLKPDGKRLVDTAVKVMKDKSDLKVSVEGHTDSIGSEAYNQKLSERRAKAVRDYLVSQGIDASRITTRGFGKSKPVASNDTAEGRAENRRVEIIPQ